MKTRNSVCNVQLFFAVACIWCVLCAATPQDNATLAPAKDFDPNTYKGKHSILFVYSIDTPRAEDAVRIMNDLYATRNEYNLELSGVCINTDRPADVLAFNRKHRVSFPVFLDTGGVLTGFFKIKSGLGLAVYNKQGTIAGTRDLGMLPGGTEIALSVKSFISRFVKIGYAPEDQPLLGIKPPVPLFEARTLGGTVVAIKKIYQHRPVIIVFFSPNCTHCQHELDLLNTQYNDQEMKGRFEILAVSRLDAKITQSMFQAKQYTFPVALDTDNSISRLFPSFSGTVPVSYLVDRSGRISFMHTGYSDYLRDNYIMELRKLCGLPTSPLLNPAGYSGQERCNVCHEKEHIQWSLTRHADAFLSLARKGRENDENCIACHVTGSGRQGGYSLTDKKENKHLEGVQCEACHGPGYESCTAFSGIPGKKRTSEEWKAVCITCHTQKESLNFNFESRFSKILHGGAPDLSKMSRAERMKLLRAYREKKDLFESQAGYVGASACIQCHQQEYEHWQTTAHATVHKTAQAHAAQKDKLYRYNTGVNGPGGYPQPEREGVQCEACHGPGERHVKEPDKKGHDYIVGLSSECSNCVVEQICRQCHAPADDPDFIFETYLGKIKHKPGTQ